MLFTVCFGDYDQSESINQSKALKRDPFTNRVISSFSVQKSCTPL